MSNSTTLHLITQIYGKKTDPEKHARMVACINHNASLEPIEKITVLCEEPEEYHASDNKINILTLPSRATYSKFLKTISEKKNLLTSHFAITNSDIFFPSNIASLLEKINHGSSVIAISRTELNGSLCRTPSMSQDSWIFCSQLINNDLIRACNYALGVAGCENLFARSLYEHGYNIWNPCLDFNFFHNDPHPKYKWESRYFGYYLFLEPCFSSSIENDSPVYDLRLQRKPWPTETHKQVKTH